VNALQIRLYISKVKANLNGLSISKSGILILFFLYSHPPSVDICFKDKKKVVIWGVNAPRLIYGEESLSDDSLYNVDRGVTVLMKRVAQYINIQQKERM